MGRRMHMFISRKRELRILDSVYEKGNSGIVLLSGREGVGKTHLIEKFTENKHTVYYLARECSEREQLFALEREWSLAYDINAEETSYEAIFSKVVSEAKEKTIIVIDEFNRIVKNTEAFLASICAVLKGSHTRQVVFVLISSDIHWITQEFSEHYRGGKAFMLEKMVLTPFSFMDIVKTFPNCDVEDAIMIYGILGGVPDYLKFWDASKSVKENVISLFLKKDAILRLEAEHFLKNNLRELSLYNTILATLADDKIRLNDVYERTGFSRAKISVYLKNLAQVGVIRKIQPYAIGKKDSAQKGLYEISDPFIHFWYKYVFPNVSYLEVQSPEWVYDKFIEPSLDAYARKYFVKVCQEFMGLMNVSGGLPIQYKRSGQWFGKEGKLDMVAEDKEGSLLVCTCKWEDEPMSDKDLEELLSYLMKAGIEPDYFYLFSRLGFTEALNEKSQYVNNLTLIALDQF